MIKNVRPSSNSRPSSAPPGPAPLDSNWDDETVPGLDLDDPLNEFDRVTAIPDVPSEQYVKSVMAAVEDSRVPLPGTAPPEPPPSPPLTPIPVLAPDEYFSLDSDPPSVREKLGSAAPRPALAKNDLPTARPAPPSRPISSLGVPALSTARRGYGLDLERIDSLSAPAHEGDDQSPLVAPPAPVFGLSLDSPAPSAFEPVESNESAIADMKHRYAMGDFSGALVHAEAILSANPDDLEAPRYAQSCRDVLTQMYSARLGSLDQHVAVAVPSDQIRWLTLDHRAGFLLSLIDGGITIDQILDISGMPRLDALRIMYQLLDQRVISLDG
ncbi:MAG TPA: hypothetical protein VFK05_34460 [Polyangiaceae bacterium]|nr:hypothetical protein [Polyangiaceae bacterium]